MTGYAWLAYEMVLHGAKSYSSVSLCFFKNVTGIPCPSCGSTRSVLAILHQEYLNAWNWNPLGYIYVLLLVIAPLWILFDGITRKETFYQFYLSIDQTLRIKWLAILLSLLIVLNWIWNIKKGN